MTTKNSHRRERSARVLQPPFAVLQLASNPERIFIDVERSGEWMPAEDLREQCLSALAAATEVTANLNGIDHLDASSLQILLALAAGQKAQGLHLQLASTSEHLQQWFEYAGATNQFLMSELKRDE